MEYNLKLLDEKEIENLMVITNSFMECEDLIECKSWKKVIITSRKMNI
jgi:hypothetical protein